MSRLPFMIEVNKTQDEVWSLLSQQFKRFLREIISKQYGPIKYVTYARWHSEYYTIFLYDGTPLRVKVYESSSEHIRFDISDKNKTFFTYVIAIRPKEYGSQLEVYRLKGRYESLDACMGTFIETGNTPEETYDVIPTLREFLGA